jgi:hypothetical protein
MKVVMITFVYVGKIFIGPAIFYKVVKAVSKNMFTILAYVFDFRMHHWAGCNNPVGEKAMHVIE